MKTIVLIPRGVQQEETDGVIRHPWHDYFVMNNALQGIIRGKNISKSALWLSLGQQIEEAAIECKLHETPTLAVSIEVNIKNKVARVLAHELGRLQAAEYGRDRLGQPTPPHIGRLGQMLDDLSKQLGQDILLRNDEEPDDEDD